MASRKWTITKLTLAFTVTCLLTITPQPVFDPNVEQLYQQGIAAYDKGDFSEAESIFSQVVQIDPNDAVAYYNLGIVLDYQGKLDDAASSLQRAIQLDPNDAKAYYSLGIVLGRQGKLDDAVASYQQAIQLNPSHYRAYNNLGNALSDQRKLEEAIASYQQAIQLNPNDAEAYNNLGNALRRQGKLEEAITSHQKALSLPNLESQPSSTHTLAHNGLGLIFQRQDKLEEAIKEYQSSLDLDPDYVAAKNNLKEAERLLAIKLKPPLPDIDDTKFLPSETDEPLVKTLRSTARIIAEVSAEGTSIGAGWVVKKEANAVWIVTNRHVISDSKTKILSKKIEVEFFSELPDTKRPRYPATIINSTDADDLELDLAVLKVTGIPDDIQKLEMRPGRVQRDANVRIIGHPYTIENPWSVSRGEVVNYNPNNPEISMSGLFAQGNSGGPVVDSENKVIGIMVTIRTSFDIVANSDQANLNLNANQPATGGVGLAYRIDIVIEKLREWGIID